MKTYGVVIRATITKTIFAEADSEDEAINLAHEYFTSECDGSDEETISIEELK